MCRKCGRHLDIPEILNPVRKTVEVGPERKRITCFDCGAELDVPVSAESTMCKKCSSYIDLKDYRITSAVSKNFKTKGTFVVEPKGYVFNTEAIVGDAVIRGRFLGKLKARSSLVVYSTAEIKGSFTTAHLVVPAANVFSWPELITLDSAEIAGELAANLKVRGILRVKPGARLFGNVEALNVVVEEGSIVVGAMRIGPFAQT